MGQLDSSAFGGLAEPGDSSPITEVLVNFNKDVWQAMADHPWVRALAAGTLEDAPLIAWAQQCRLFCIEERKALINVDFALRDLGVPQSLLDALAALIDDTEREPRELAETLESLGAPVKHELWPTALGYTSFVRLSAREGPLEGLAAIYSCERAYLDTWTAVLSSVPVGSRWSDWINNWTCDVFRSTVGALGDGFNTVAVGASDETFKRMASAFRNVALFEYAFWDMCWRQQGWGLGDRS